MAKKLRNIRLYTSDILQSIGRIIEYTNDLNFEEFSKENKTIDAVIRNFEIIGEATNHLPQLFKSKHSEVEWRILIDFRNVIIHEYFGVNLEIIWDIIKNELPILSQKIKSIHDSLNDDLIEWELD